MMLREGLEARPNVKLLYTPIAGYVHTVEAVINYAGLCDAVEPVPTKPFDADTGLPGINPIGKVPTLVLDDGEYLAGGPVIYEYLDTLHDRPRLYPPSGRHRFSVLRQAWMADVLFDQFVLLIVEGWIDPPAQRPAYIARCWSKVVGILNRMETDVRSYSGLDIAQVRGVGALAFLDLKLSEVGASVTGIDAGYDWRTGRPRLAAWYGALAAEAMFSSPLLTPGGG